MEGPQGSHPVRGVSLGRFFEGRIKRDLVTDDFDKALSKARKLAKSKDLLSVACKSRALGCRKISHFVRSFGPSDPMLDRSVEGLLLTF